MSTDTITTTITASITDASEPEEIGGPCYADYTIELHVGERTIRVGGWVLCGWLAPGAHADLDGSGLSLWGDSQPGGWTTCSGDGCFHGRPCVEVLRDGECWDPIEIEIPEGASYTGEPLINPADVPAWAAAVQAAREARAAADRDPENGAAEDRATEADDRAEAIREWLVERINEALEDADPEDGVEIAPEPDAETLYDELDEIDGLEALPIRLGHWEGAGIAMAWRDLDWHYSYTYWPNGDDVRRALEETQIDTITGILAQIDRLQED